MARAETTTFTGISVDRNGTVRDVCDATGNLYHLGTKLTFTAAEINNVGDKGGYFPQYSTQMKMQLKNATVTASKPVNFSQLTTINAVFAMPKKQQLGASQVGGGCPKSFSYRLNAGATIHLYGWKGGAAATAAGIAHLLAIGT